ncbi:MAG: antibiotic biosynthesis monooxygenase [Gammaproteobacteria bacterium]|nr:MAG: antibiotic biosynthesis monooxygenase [Gammaproteobacteria bacterium]
MLAFIATLSVKADIVEEFKANAPELMAKVRQEPGNHAYIGHQSPDDPTRFVFYEQYDDEAALLAHRENLAAMGVDLQALLTEPPSIELLNLL